MIFVFGSNLAGRHGKGAAKYAVLKYEAEYGVGEGRTGNAYAIPTKDEVLRTLPLKNIRASVNLFKDYVHNNPDLTFQLTPIGCGLAGYAYEEIGPLFKRSPVNVIIPIEFKPFV